VPALGLVGLAALVGLLGTRGRGRSALGAVLALCGVAVVLLAGPHLAAPSPAATADLVAGRGPLPGRDLARPVQPRAESGWPALAAAGGVLLAATGALTVVRGRRWPAMSGRYDAPTARLPAGRLPDSHSPGRSDPAEPVSPGQPRVEPEPPRLVPTQRLWDALDRGDDPTDR